MVLADREIIRDGMAIPRERLETWANQGATTTAVATHTSVRFALETAGTSLVRGRDIEVFLQGSYRNATNIYADSDVDIVVLLKETYARDPSALVGAQREAERQAFESSPATYKWQDFRRDVLISLQRHYGASVGDGNKAITVAGGNGRLSADVIPAIVYKRYVSYGLTIATGEVYVEGISFWDKAWRNVVNYPKEHIEKGQAKNGIGRANGNYKSTVRMFKNARRYLVDKGRVGATIAPSYFVECLVYNAPDNLFVADRQGAMRGVLEWLLGADKTLFLCQNEQVLLVGGTAEQWPLANANAFLGAMVDMWNQWPI